MLNFPTACRFGAACVSILIFAAALQAIASQPASAATVAACVQTIEPLADADRTLTKPLDAKHYLNTPAVITACGSLSKAVAEIEKKNSSACKALLQGDLPQPKPNFTTDGDIMKNCGEPSHAKALYQRLLAAYVPPASAGTSGAASTPAPGPTRCSNTTKESQARLCERTQGKHGK